MSMANRQHTAVGVIIDQENTVSSRLAVKSINVSQPVKALSSRAALGEVGNKILRNKDITKNIPHVIKEKDTKTQIVLKKSNNEKENPSNKILHDKNQTKVVLKAKSDNVSNILEYSKAFSSKQLSIIDPDESSKDDPQMVTEYISDIFNYLRELEIKYPVHTHFLEHHQTTPKMRAILVNWLVEVHLNFKLYLETLHLCIALVDRYLQDNKSVTRNTLQLVGTSAMYVSCKYEEMYVPTLEDFVYICADSFSQSQILKMEQEILKKLDFNLGRPLSVHFLRRYSKIAQVEKECHTLGKYLLELTLLDYDMCHIRPSLQAAAAFCLAIGILNDVMDWSKIWTPTMAYHSSYKYTDFRSVIIDMAHLLVNAEKSSYQTIRKKYSTATYGKISLNSKLHGPLVKKLTATKK